MNKKVKIFVIGISGLFITLSALNFYNFYFARYPILNQENYWLGERVLDKYVELIGTGKPVQVITDRPRSSYLRYIFYSGESTQKEMLKVLVPYGATNQIYQIGSITFTDKCPTILYNNTAYIMYTNVNCKTAASPDFSIVDQKDAGTLVKIYGSPVCSGVSNEKWRRFSYFSDYNIEKMDYKTFCSRWINIPE